MKASECFFLEGGGKKVFRSFVVEWRPERGSCGCDNWLCATKPHGTTLRVCDSGVRAHLFLGARLLSLSQEDKGRCFPSSSIAAEGLIAFSRCSGSAVFRGTCTRNSSSDHPIAIAPRTVISGETGCGKPAAQDSCLREVIGRFG